MRRGGGRSSRGCQRGYVFVGLEYIQPLQLLVQDSKRLKSLRLVHLCFEPVLHFVLPIVFEVLMYVIEVPVGCIKHVAKHRGEIGRQYLFNCSNVTCELSATSREAHM